MSAANQLALDLTARGYEVIVTPICSAEVPVTIGGCAGRILCMATDKADGCGWHRQYGRVPVGCWAVDPSGDLWEPENGENDG